jgi:hypothetical protein
MEHLLDCVIQNHQGERFFTDGMLAHTASRFLALTVDWGKRKGPRKCAVHKVKIFRSVSYLADQTSSSRMPKNSSSARFQTFPAHVLLIESVRRACDRRLIPFSKA